MVDLLNGGSVGRVAKVLVKVLGHFQVNDGFHHHPIKFLPSAKDV